MGTADIALEKVQALLRVDTGSGSLHDHLVRLAQKLAEGGGGTPPPSAFAQLETLSQQLKQSHFRGSPAQDGESAQTIDPDKPAEARRLAWCEHSLRLAKPSDPACAPQVIRHVQNFMEDSAMFEWAGVGFGKQESFHIAMSLRKLATETTSLQRLRLWGKVLGTAGDYYVAEGVMQAPSPARPLPNVLPNNPEYDVEPRGEGVNTNAYWVSAGGAAPWVRLPSARAGHIRAARLTKRLMTGDLDNPVRSTPWFQGKERNLLRAQIARIAASCTLAVKGYYEADEDTVGSNKIKVVETPADAFSSQDDLETQAGWCHCAPAILSTGRTTWPGMEDLDELIAANLFTEDEKKTLEEQIEAEAPPLKEMNLGIEGDLEELELKPEGSELVGSVAWTVTTHGDKGVYTFGDAPKKFCVTAVRSNIWPGAVAVQQGVRFANLYVGYALKCGTLLPADPKTGLPLSGTCPFSPLAPEDIQDEPKPGDLKMEEEPNPLQDEEVSDGGDLEEGEEEAE